MVPEEASTEMPTTITTTVDGELTRVMLVGFMLVSIITFAAMGPAMSVKIIAVCINDCCTLPLLPLAQLSWLCHNSP